MIISRRRNVLQDFEHKFMCYTGMETDLIFSQFVELPEFAAFPLMETEAGLKLIDEYYKRLILLADKKNIGVILESVTWVASPDRAEKLGYSADELVAINQKAVEIMQQARDAYGDVPTLLSANIGPRQDAYLAESVMSAAEAEDYHKLQITAIVQTQADFITAYTVGNVDEAIGMVRAARAVEMPIVMSFTVEMDGRLPTGDEVKHAIIEVDAATDGFALYYMLNCAHPEHFEAILADVMPLGRLSGLVMNASKCSHAELDNATELDDGNPSELGMKVKEIVRKYSKIRILGGCCGTDMRHLNEMFEEV